MFWRFRREIKHCPHSNLDPIYGDAINMSGGFRLWCRDCRRKIDGPVALAERRKNERDVP